MRVGEIAKKIRLRRGVGLTEISEVAKVAGDTYLNWEMGKTDLPFLKVLSIMEHLKMKLVAEVREGVVWKRNPLKRR